VDDPIALFAARFVMGEVRTDEVPDAAAGLIVSGFDSPSLRELAGADRWDGEQVRRLFLDALAEMGRRAPSPSEARRAVAETWIREMASGATDPYTACRRIWQEVWNVGDQDDDLTPFVDLADDWEDARSEERPGIEEEMRAAARGFLDGT
jgi:hypothetical protein